MPQRELRGHGAGERTSRALVQKQGTAFCARQGRGLCALLGTLRRGPSFHSDGTAVRGLPYGGRTARRCNLGPGPRGPAPEATLSPLGAVASPPREFSGWQSLMHRHQCYPAAPTCTSCSVEGETSISFCVTPKLPFRLVSLTCCCSKGTRYRNVSSTPRIRRVGCSSSTGTSKPREAATRSRNVGSATW